MAEFNIFDLRIFIDIPYRSLTILVLLLIGLSIAYWFMVRLRKKRVLKFGNFETLRKVEGYKRFSISPILFFLRAFIIIVLFLVATESIQVNMMKPVANANVMIAMDVSSTMGMPDYLPSRLEAAKEAASEQLISVLPEATKVGVVTFSSKAILLLEPTNDALKVQGMIDSIRTSGEAGTAMGDALKLSAAVLNKTRPKKEKIVILFTDGKNNVGSDLSQAVAFLKEDDVKVYTIGIGNNNKTIEMFSVLNQTLNLTKKYTQLSFPVLDSEGLQNVSDLTGGKFLLINDEKSLEESLSGISVHDERIPLNSEFYILLFITMFMIIELVLFSKYGAI